MQIFQNEPNSVLRRIPIALFRDSDGITSVTGVTLSSTALLPTAVMKVYKNGAAGAAPSGSLVELDSGDYYYTASQTEVDTIGYLTGRIVATGLRTFRFSAQVIAQNLYAGVALSPSGLDYIDMTVAASGNGANFAERMNQVWRKGHKKNTLSATQMLGFADDGTTVNLVQSVTDAGGLQTLGPAD